MVREEDTDFEKRDSEVLVIYISIRHNDFEIICYNPVVPVIFVRLQGCFRNYSESGETWMQAPTYLGR